MPATFCLFPKVNKLVVQRFWKSEEIGRKGKREKEKGKREKEKGKKGKREKGKKI